MRIQSTCLITDWNMITMRFGTQCVSSHRDSNNSPNDIRSVHGRKTANSTLLGLPNNTERVNQPITWPQIDASICEDMVKTAS